jgi:pSer/pThr/pTyr-binding forkhead associated (FHA) protein
MSQVVFNVGRNRRKNHLFVEDKSVSNNHAQVVIKDGIVSIVDLGSSNGTFVNYKRINGEVTVGDNDVITFGTYKCTRRDLVNAAQKFEYKNHVITNNIKLLSSLPSNEKPLNKNKRKLIPKIVIAILVLASFLVINHLFGVDEIIKSKLKSTSFLDFKSKQKKDVTYDFSCLSNSNEDAGSISLLNVFGDITKEVQSVFLEKVNIPLSEEVEYGTELLETFKSKNLIVSSGKEYDKLNNILVDISSRVLNPRGFDYEIFLVEDSLINVFTSGGKIFFFRGMLDFTINDSELAVLISHEVSHNELGHITFQLKKIKQSENWGLFGQVLLAVNDMITVSFNQKQEAEADLFGVDLVFPTRYSTCSGIDLFDRLSEKESEFNLADNLFRSHPYSSSRSNCIVNHLETNYNMNCDE